MGVFTGDYGITWLSPRLYLYRPARGNPLTYTTDNGTKIILSDVFETDGATIPRIFWSIPGFSPFDFFKAALVHDWLYEMHHAGTSPIDFYEANEILEEACVAIGYSKWKAKLVRRMCDLFGHGVWDRGL